ncbi:MAG: hemerythrin domain-containing protein [Bdellovibrionales bacterium]
MSLNIYDVLKKDHNKIKSLLQELVDCEMVDGMRCQDLVEALHFELLPHTHAEEAVFYNSLRSLRAARPTIMHSYEEHMEIENLLRALQIQSGFDDHWINTAHKLKAAIERHLKEEEGSIFNMAQSLFLREEEKMMGEAFLRLRPQVAEEGLVRVTLDAIADLMPTRFAATLRTFDLNPK